MHTSLPPSLLSRLIAIGTKKKGEILGFP